MSPSAKFFLLAGLGVFTGMVLFLVHISNFFSYLSDDPKTCMNCHIMGPEYATWAHSSHRERATCNDCHVPQDNFFHKWSFKAADGLRHSTIFTLRAEPQAIIIKPAGRAAVQSNCQRCHQPQFANTQELMKTTTFSNTDAQDAQNKPFDLVGHILLPSHSGRNCWECHRETPHGRSRSISATPYARVPTTGSMVPTWLNELLVKKEE